MLKLRALAILVKHRGGAYFVHIFIQTKTRLLGKTLESPVYITRVQQESNLRPFAPEANALSPELWTHIGRMLL